MIPVNQIQSRPNILLVFTDQQRFDTIRALGSKFSAQTPHMDALVKEGVVFDQCFCTAPICSPSRATMMTGLFPHQAGMPGNLYAPCPPLSVAIPTLGNFLRAGGYETAYHGKWHMGGHVKDYGFDVGRETSHDPSSVNEAADFWRNRDWIANERPFFHVVSLINPHDLYYYDQRGRVENFRRPWKNCGRPVEELPPVVKNRITPDWPEEKWGEYFKYYSEQIERCDKDLGELIHMFRTGGYFNNSWIIFTTDHGDMAGEQDLPFKGPWMYEGQVKIPMVIIPPQTHILGADRSGVFEHNIAPFTCSSLCSNLDLAPTIMDLAGIKKPDNMAGKSLLPWIKKETDGDVHDVVFAQWHQPPLRMTRTRRYKWVKYLDGFEEFFDLQEDPNETRNLAGKPEVAQAQEDLKARFIKYLRDSKDPFCDLKDHEYIFDPTPYTWTGTKAKA